MGSNYSGVVWCLCGTCLKRKKLSIRAGKRDNGWRTFVLSTPRFVRTVILQCVRVKVQAVEDFDWQLTRCAESQRFSDVGPDASFRAVKSTYVTFWTIAFAIASFSDTAGASNSQ